MSWQFCSFVIYGRIWERQNKIYAVLKKSLNISEVGDMGKKNNFPSVFLDSCLRPPCKKGQTSRRKTNRTLITWEMPRKKQILPETAQAGTLAKSKEVKSRVQPKEESEWGGREGILRKLLGKARETRVRTWRRCRTCPLRAASRGLVTLLSLAEREAHFQTEISLTDVSILYKRVTFTGFCRNSPASAVS